MRAIAFGLALAFGFSAVAGGLLLLLHAAIQPDSQTPGFAWLAIAVLAAVGTFFVGSAIFRSLNRRR